LREKLGRQYIWIAQMESTWIICVHYVCCLFILSEKIKTWQGVPNPKLNADLHQLDYDHCGSLGCRPILQ